MFSTTRKDHFTNEVLAYLKRFSLAVACYSWTLSCLLEKVPLGPLRSLGVLDRVCTRLRQMSSLFLIVRSRLMWNRSDALNLQDVPEFVNASLILEEIFLHFKPVNAVCFALYEYSRCGGTTGRNKAPCVVATKMLEGEGEIELYGDALCETIMDTISTCELQTLGILSQFKPLSDRLSDLRASVDDVHSEFSQQYSKVLLKLWALGPQAGFLKPLGRRNILLRMRAPNYTVRAGNPAVLDSTVRFEDLIFSSDVVQAVVVEESSWTSLFLQKVPKAPDLLSLRLQNLGSQHFDKFHENKETLADLQNLTLVLTYLAIFDRPNCSFSSIFKGHYTKQDEVDAGRFILRDKQLVSIGYGRRKERPIFLFEHWLVFCREKGHHQIGVQMVPLKNILLVFYRRQSMGAVLTVYWNQGTSESSERQNISGAEIYFVDMDALTIWAAFLSLATTASRNGLANQSKSEETQTWPTLKASEVDNRHVKFLLDLGPISVKQALHQLLPPLRSQVLYPNESARLWKQLEDLGERVLRQNEIAQPQTAISD